MRALNKGMISLTAAALLVAGSFTGNCVAGDEEAVEQQETMLEKSNKLSRDQKEKLQAILKERRSKLRPIMHDLDVKTLQLRTYGTTPQADPSIIGKMAEEVVTLREKARSIRREAADKIHRELGISLIDHPKRGDGRRGADPYQGCPAVPPCYDIHSDEAR